MEIIIFLVTHRWNTAYYPHLWRRVGSQSRHVRISCHAPADAHSMIGSPWPLDLKSGCCSIKIFGTSLVAQWLGIRLPMQGTQVRALVREDPICHRATKPVSHNYWACALEPASHNYWARMPQLLKLACPKPVLRNKRSPRNEKPMHHKEE